jgi:tRNA-modifying protein YgfZ
MTSPWTWIPSGACRLERPAGLMRLDGPDALRVLHGQTSASIEGAQPGSWIPTCCITATARLRALAEVLVDEGGAWLLVGSGDPALVHQAIDRVLFPADQVKLGPLQAVRWITPLGSDPQGPDAAAAGRWQRCGGGSGWRLGNTMVLPQDQPLPPELAARRLLEPAEAERWRIQQGLPAVPAELNDDHNPFELGLAGRVGLSKGCYVGQETLAKLATYDGVKQQLRRWHWRRGTGGPAPDAGQSLFSPSQEGGGQEGRLGRITSVLELADGERIGLALVRRTGLGLPQLQAGEDPGAALLSLSQPEQFAAPPVGAGGGS